MKHTATIFLLLMALQTLGQNQLKDTVKIKSVIIETQQNITPNQERLDSAVLNSPEHNNLGDLLAKKSHLFIKSYGIGSLATISLRGSGSAHTQINWNGISLNSSMNGTSDLALFPLLFMDEVEVNYGLSSISDGAGGIGGAVNISSKPNFTKKAQGSVSYTIGSFGQEQWNGKILVGNKRLQSSTKVFHNKAANNFEYLDLTQEGFPTREVQNASFLQRGLLQNLHYRLKDNQWLEANVWWFESNRNLPPLITLRDNIEYQEDIAIKSLISYSNYFKNSKLKVTLAFLDDQIYYENQRASIASKSNAKSFKSRIDYDFSWKEIEFKSQLKFDNNSATADGLTEAVNQNRMEVFSNAVKKIGEQFKIQIAARQLMVLEEDGYFLPQAKLSFTSNNKRLFSHLKAGKNVKYPNLNDLYFEPSGNINLEAEEAFSAELLIGRSLSSELIGADAELSVTAFYNDIENYIQWEPTAFWFWQPTNLTSVETYGVEVYGEAQKRFGKLKAEINGTYSYTSSKNWEKEHDFDESEGKQLIYIPEHKGNVSLDLEYKSYLLSTNYQVIGVRFISSDNSEFLPSYSLLDASLSRNFDIKKHTVGISFGVKNVLDTEYQAIQWRPMPNRNYFVKLSYQFKK